jgi:hypothetical protein
VGDNAVNEVSFYNTSGVLVKQVTENNMQSCIIKDLAGGLYMVKFATKHGYAVKRMLVMHQ